jgi:hypothetical protein
MTRVTDKQIAEAADGGVVRYWLDRSDLAKMKKMLAAQFEAELAKVEPRQIKDSSRRSSPDECGRARRGASWPRNPSVRPRTCSMKGV